MTVAGTKQAPAKRGAKASEEAQTTMADRPAEHDLLALDTPVLSLRIHRPHLRLPRLATAPAGRAARAARSALPPPSRLAYYGGLGAAAALGAIEWPVAVAIGVGTAIGQRVRRDGRRAQQAGQRGAPPEDPTAKPEPEVTPGARGEPKGAAGTEQATRKGETSKGRPGGDTRTS